MGSGRMTKKRKPKEECIKQVKRIRGKEVYTMYAEMKQCRTLRETTTNCCKIFAVCILTLERINAGDIFANKDRTLAQLVT